MPLPTAAELTDPAATNSQMKERLVQIVDNVATRDQLSEQFVRKFEGQNLLDFTHKTTSVFVNLNENKLQAGTGFDNVETWIIQCNPDTTYFLNNFTDEPLAFGIHGSEYKVLDVGSILEPISRIRIDANTVKITTDSNTNFLYINKSIDNFTNLIDSITADQIKLFGKKVLLEESVEIDEEDGGSVNIFKDSQLVAGKVVNVNDGNLLNFTSFIIAQIPVKPNQLLNIKCNDYRADAFALAFRETSDIEPGSTFGLLNNSNISFNSDNSFDVTVPYNANFLLINVNYFAEPLWDIRENLIVQGSGVSDHIVKINNLPICDAYAREMLDKMTVLKAKKWVVIGDSISDYTYRPYAGYSNYAEQLEYKHSMTVYKYGQSGSGFYNRYNSLNQITQGESDVDFITVFLGTNDWGNINSNYKPLGEFGDTSSDTISGCINLFIQDLNARFPNTPIGFFTPLPRFDAWGENATNNSQGYKLNELVDLIKRYAGHYSIPVLDLYNQSTFKCQTSVQKSEWTVGGDGVHPTHLAHTKLIKIIELFLQNLI